MPAFRYVLELANGQPADPALFTTALPPACGNPATRSSPRATCSKFRIVEIGELANPDLEDIHGVWIVEPVEGLLNGARGLLAKASPAKEAKDGQDNNDDDDDPKNRHVVPSRKSTGFGPHWRTTGAPLRSQTFS